MQCAGLTLSDLLRRCFLLSYPAGRRSSFASAYSLLNPSLKYSIPQYPASLFHASRFLSPPRIFLSQSSEETACTVPSTPLIEQKVFEPPRPSRVLSARDFKALEFLGEGAYGRVLLVSDKWSGNRFALKVVNKREAEAHRAATKHLLAEQRALVEVVGVSGFVQLHGSWHDQRNYYFLMVCLDFSSFYVA